MPVAEMFRVNYFVGALLAQGGNLHLEESKIIFSPTSAIDRAMGAHDVEITYDEIQDVDYSGALSRSFTIKTDDKIHKFEGSQAKKVWELLEKTLNEKGLFLSGSSNDANSGHQSAPLVCSQCEQKLQPGYAFCPHCGTRIKSACQSCHKAIAPNWVACAFCGSKFTSAA